MSETQARMVIWLALTVVGAALVALWVNLLDGERDADRRLGLAILRQRGRCEYCGVAMTWVACSFCQAGEAPNSALCYECAGFGGWWEHQCAGEREGVSYGE